MIGNLLQLRGVVEVERPVVGAVVRPGEPGHVDLGACFASMCDDLCGGKGAEVAGG